MGYLKPPPILAFPPEGGRNKAAWVEISARKFFHHSHQFTDGLFALSGADRMLHTTAGVLFQQLHAEGVQGGLNRGNLRQDIDAVAILLDHLGHAANLSGNAVDAVGDAGFIRLDN